MKASNEELRLAYEVAVTNYLAAFLEMYDLSCDSEPWVANDIGTVACIGDYFFNFHDIKFCVDKQVKWKDLIEWYDYTLDTHEFGFECPNLQSWLKGCPRVRPDIFKTLRKERDKYNDLIDEIKEGLKQ